MPTSSSEAISMSATKFTIDPFSSCSSSLSSSSCASSSSSSSETQITTATTTPKRLHVSNIPFRFRDPDLRAMFGVIKHNYII